MKTISFSILSSTLQLFLFFPFLQQFTAGENLRVAGDSAGRRRILTTLQATFTFNPFSPNSDQQQFSPNDTHTLS